MKLKIRSHLDSIYPSLRRLIPSSESVLHKLELSDGSTPDLNEQVLEEGQAEIAESEGSMLCPQAYASFLGLRKLIEKDWFDNEASLNLQYGLL